MGGGVLSHLQGTRVAARFCRGRCARRLRLSRLELIGGDGVFVIEFVGGVLSKHTHTHISPFTARGHTPYRSREHM